MPTIPIGGNDVKGKLGKAELLRRHGRTATPEEFHSRRHRLFNPRIQRPDNGRGKHLRKFREITRRIDVQINGGRALRHALEDMMNKPRLAITTRRN